MKEQKEFAVIYITPDMMEPEIVARIRSGTRRFQSDRLFWSSWGMIAGTLANSYQSKNLLPAEEKFALDLLAYLAKKGLWKSTLPDAPVFHSDKLYRSLLAADSSYIASSKRKRESDQSWRLNKWDESELRVFLQSLRWEEKVLLKTLAEAGGAMQQGHIMRTIPFFKGRKSSSLGALKAHTSDLCKSRAKAPLLVPFQRSNA